MRTKKENNPEINSTYTKNRNIHTNYIKTPCQKLIHKLILQATIS